MMSLTIELSPLTEQQIQQEAEREGVSVSEVVQRTLEARFPTASGASAVANGDAAPLSNEEREAEEQIFEQLHANMNETRCALGMGTY